MQSVSVILSVNTSREKLRRLPIEYTVNLRGITVLDIKLPFLLPTNSEFIAMIADKIRIDMMAS
ncbi:hypothetical protein [Lysinibacillus sp. BNK-21]|uniref:hypothetical protein n=1 Tax=Lysinibacillus sp. BNK-21 TaxID=3376156 RepID=UPI003B42F484